jgi:hypothetical protein
MKTLTSLIFILSSFVLISYAQLVTEVNSSEYKKLRVFSDEFVDNRFDWVYDESNLNRIQFGSLFYANPFEFPYYDGKPIMLDINKDFEIETNVKFISGDVTKFNGLFWGDLIFGDKMFFGFSTMGEFQIKLTSGFEQKIIAQEKTDVIDRSGFNLLSVVKIGQKYYFYINNQKVYEMPFNQFTGRYFGFGIAPKSYIQISFLKIWYLQQL